MLMQPCLGGPLGTLRPLGGAHSETSAATQWQLSILGDAFDIVGAKPMASTGLPPRLNSDVAQVSESQGLQNAGPTLPAQYGLPMDSHQGFASCPTGSLSKRVYLVTFLMPSNEIISN